MTAAMPASTSAVTADAGEFSHVLDRVVLGGR
jgi:hypothetical protein